MNTIFTKVSKALLLVSLMLGAYTANAATFTAVSSGNWTSGATWSGGVAPGSNISSDDIIIPAGITVMLDTDVEFTGGPLSSMDVDGQLESMSENKLTMSLGDLSGSGTLILENLEFGAFGTMSFTGNADIEKMINSNASLVLTSAVSIADTITLEDGQILLSTGSNLTMNSNSVVKVNNGTILISGGLFTAANPYSALYVGVSKNGGIELSGDGLTNLEINLDDNDQVLTFTANVDVDGDFDQQSGDVDMNGFDLTLNGDYTTVAGADFMGDPNSSLIVNSTSTITSSIHFMENEEELNDFTFNGSSASTLTLNSDLVINGNMTVQDGEVFVTSGNTLELTDNSQLTMNNGDLTINSGGTFDGSAEYNVVFMGQSNGSGVVFTGSGLNDVTIMMDDENQEVMLESDATINGMLSLQSGDFDLNANDLMLMGDFESNGSAEIQGDVNSDITIMTTSDLSDTLFFDASTNEINTLTLDIDGSGSAMLGSNLTAENIDLTSGVLILFDNDLELNSTGTISGADENNYISTQGSGSLWMNVNVSSPYIMYPVGTDEGYSPARIQINNGTSGTFGVNAANGVLQWGYSGTDLTASESLVDRTWNVSYGTASSTDINLMVSWSTAMEVNGFDNTDAQISHYVNSNWDSDVSAMATLNASGMYELERTGITSLSPFAVKDGQSALSVEEQSVVFNTYPNPATDELNIDLSAVEGTVNIQLVDGVGNILKNYQPAPGTTVEKIDFTKLPTGVYIIQINAENGVATKRVVKS
ncbi:MAG: T9SS type A sorting domain-containing protein [Fluviicola sp.]